VLFRPVVALRVASIPIGGFGARVPAAAAAAAETFCCGQVECVYALQRQEDNACLQKRFDGMGKVVAAVGSLWGFVSTGYFWVFSFGACFSTLEGCVMKNAKGGRWDRRHVRLQDDNALLKIAGVWGISMGRTKSDVNRSIR
jgi:hypothetical protein